MSAQPADLYALLGQLEWTAVDELSDVSDYIWKSPKFVSHEKALEERKLAAYFPNDAVSAALRRRFEFKRLNETFPRLIAVTNLFLALSVFENYVLLLLKILREHKPTVPKNESRPGVAAHLKALKAYGADPCNAKYYEQVCVAISIRNCLMHTKGFLAIFRESDALRNQISERMFLCSEDRKRGAYQALSSGSDIVAIECSELGDQVVITNDYAHHLCYELREYFCALCGTLNPNTALWPIVYQIDPRELALTLSKSNTGIPEQNEKVSAQQDADSLRE